MPDLLEFADPERRDRPLIAPVRTPPTSPAVAEFHQTPSQVSPTVAPVLVFQHVSKWYGPVIGVNQVTLELRPGITGLVGHNGAGKSTLLRLAAGQIRPDLGDVKIAGIDAWSASAKLHVGYCPENDRFYEEMSGRNFVHAMAMLAGFSRTEANRRVERTLELVGMADRASRKLAGYSKGMRQRIKLAQALLHDPALLLLDEPLSGIDPVGRRESLELFRKLAEQGKCVLLSSHELDELEKLTDHVAIMAAGRVVAVGTLPHIRELLNDQPLSIRIQADDLKTLAKLLWSFDEVVGVERNSDFLLVRARQPRQFFEKFQLLVIEENLEIQQLQTLDDSTQDVLGYLLRR